MIPNEERGSRPLSKRERETHNLVHAVFNEMALSEMNAVALYLQKRLILKAFRLGISEQKKTPEQSKIALAFLRNLELVMEQLDAVVMDKAGDVQRSMAYSIVAGGFDFKKALVMGKSTADCIVDDFSIEAIEVKKG